MLCSKACQYAIRAVVRLGAGSSDGLAMVRVLSEELGLPRHFVAKIFKNLVHEGILVSRKGRGGGFSLARPSKEIRIVDVMAAIDGAEQMTACPLGYGKCTNTQPCAYHDHWVPVRDRIYGRLATMTIADLEASLSDGQEAAGGTNGLKGLRVLVVEDSFLVGDAIKRMLLGMGCKVVGPEPTLDAAARVLDEAPIDGALLDIELGGVTSAPIALRLLEQSRPFFFISGYGNLDMLPPPLRSCRRLSKPIGEEALRSALVEEICANLPASATS